MKKCLSLLLAFATTLSTLFCLAGCGDTPSTNDLPRPTDPPIVSQSYSWNGITYQVGSDMEESHRSDVYVDYDGDGISVRILSGYLEEGVNSADDLAAETCADLVEDGNICSQNTSGGVCYVTAEKDNTFQVYGNYAKDGFGWQMWGTLFNTTEFEDPDAAKERLIEYVTSGVITSVPDSRPSVPDPTEPTSEYVTVHAYIPDDWSAPGCWAWLSSPQENVFTEWPGEAMTPTSDHYTIELPAWVDSIIINANGGADQTEDIAIEPGKDVWIIVDPNGSTVYYRQPTEAELNPDIEEKDTITVYAFVPDTWANPGCWAWLSSPQENVFDEWPGEAMTPTSDHYTIELPTWVDSIIINANGGADQTEDIAIEPGKDVWISINPDGSITSLLQ